MMSFQPLDVGTQIVVHAFETSTGLGLEFAGTRACLQIILALAEPNAVAVLV